MKFSEWTAQTREFQSVMTILFDEIKIALPSQKLFVIIIIFDFFYQVASDPQDCFKSLESFNSLENNSMMQIRETSASQKRYLYRNFQLTENVELWDFHLPSIFG